MCDLETITLKTTENQTYVLLREFRLGLLFTKEGLLQMSAVDKASECAASVAFIVFPSTTIDRIFGGFPESESI